MGQWAEGASVPSPYARLAAVTELALLVGEWQDAGFIVGAPIGISLDIDRRAALGRRRNLSLAQAARHTRVGELKSMDKMLLG